jgi:apolipoprotein N-acyltransferase
MPVARYPIALFCFGAALLSAGLLWACYFPLAWGGYLGWVALVPLLVLVRTQLRSRTVYLIAWAAGLLFFVPVLQWMRYADYRMYATWILLAIYCSLYFPATLWGIRLLDSRRVPLIVSVPLVWVGLEFLRSFLMTGFAWYYLGHTQHDVLPMIQITDLGGVYLVSALVAAVNAFLFDCLYQQPEVREWFGQSKLEPAREYASIDFFNRSFFADWHFRRNLILEGAILAAALVGTLIYGQVRLSQDNFADGPIVCLLQSNLPQQIRNDADKPGDAASEVVKEFSKLCERASRGHHPPPDIIIWPETSYPAEWIDISGLKIEDASEDLCRAELAIRQRLSDTARITGMPHLIGMNTSCVFKGEGKDPYKVRRYNSALYVNRQGSITERFDKMHRVPFGEYVPLKDWLPFMNAFAPYDFDYSIQQGEKFTRFKLKNHTFGVVICYEDTDPFLARRYLNKDGDGEPVDFLVNISNDGWFDGSSEHEQHLAVSRFRAIECRRAMVRAVNMGVSAVIDSNGRVLKPTPHRESEANAKVKVWEVARERGRIAELSASEWDQFKSVSGVLKAAVPIDNRASFYTVGGDWFPIGCWIGFVGALVWTFLRRQTSV